MELVKFPIHQHPLLPVTRFHRYDDECGGCESRGYIYGGYWCNEMDCFSVCKMFHKECAESLPVINNHSSHPHHPLELRISSLSSSSCNQCRGSFRNGYFCSICDFKLDLNCARGQGPLLVLENPHVHEHPLELYHHEKDLNSKKCKTCDDSLAYLRNYRCSQCELYFHEGCAKFFPEANHTSHPQHPLKLLSCKVKPDYADKQCLLCGYEFRGRFHHCDFCNFSICSECMENPPPVKVISLTTHEHQLHLVPRHLEFTCNACGTKGHRRPYFCLQCNFMIHWDCIDLPRVININRHDHRVSYTRRLGHGSWKCGVCRKKVDGFYGAYSCSKCSDYAVHPRCATRKDVWDMVELEGTLEEEEIPPFEVVDENTIKHFGHDHNLRINKDGHTLHESILCQACIFQICSETYYYSCVECDFIIHEKCANLPRNKRHVFVSKLLRLRVDLQSLCSSCELCGKHFVGFRYETTSGLVILDVRCGSIAEPFEHESHPHPLFYNYGHYKTCTICGDDYKPGFGCDECEDFKLCFTCGMLPQKVMRKRYDDHPLFLSYGESNVEGNYWCEACETKVNPKKWFYTCNDCGVTLHISCVVGDFSYVLPGSLVLLRGNNIYEVVPNTSISRLVCTVCNSRCKLPSILKDDRAKTVVYICSLKCREVYKQSPWSKIKESPTLTQM